jgi:hypothetical protein
MDLQAPAPCEINVLDNLRLQSRGVCWRYSSLEFMIMHSVYDGGYFCVVSTSDISEVGLGVSVRDGRS